MGWCPVPAEDDQNMPSLWRHLQKTPPKTKNVFFSVPTRRLAESVEGSNQLSTSSGWRFMAQKGSVRRRQSVKYYLGV